jgi:hypothetical protein
LQRVGDSTEKIKLLIAAAGVKRRLNDTAEALEYLAQAEKMIEGAANIDDLSIRVSAAVEWSVDLAAAYGEFGLKEKAGALLASASRLADTIESREYPAVEPPSSIDWASADRADQVAVMARIAGGYLHAGEPQQAAALVNRCRDTALTIRDEQWRATAWKEMAQVYLVIAEPQLALAVLEVGERPDLQKSAAFEQIYEAFRERHEVTQAARVLDEMPDSWNKTSLFVGLANEAAAAGNKKQAQALIAQALRSMSESGGNWERRLILIANEYRFAAEPADKETQALLSSIMMSNN